MTSSRMRRVVGVAALAAALAASAGTVDAGYAPIDRPGPPLSVPEDGLARALNCSPGLAGAERSPILLIPGTTLSPREDFSWGWQPALDAERWPYCALTLPNYGMSDIQVAAEYVVYAIRSMYATSGRKVAVVGHSQGGMVPRWALRFWPDTRDMVDDLVGLAPSNHGTLDADLVCALPCAPSFWQQRSRAAFIRVLNSGQETFPGPTYTVVYTRTDEVVVPNTGGAGSSALRGPGQITNVALQEICPLDLTEHLGIATYDNVAYRLAMDALTHPGPANPARIDRSVCRSLLMPGVDAATFPLRFADLALVVARELAVYPRVPAEPPLRCYVVDTCP